MRLPLTSLLPGLIILFFPTLPLSGQEKKTNRLARESSPYLLQHAHNPVDWYPWGEEAFARAKKEKKLVFLSIGYSSCHWCHVMEKESFADEEVAKYLNRHFICIKVDREERPDVDQIYMTSLNVLSISGGWPLSMFLTTEGKPIFGGTYWPREDREVDGEKVMGFKSVLRRAQELYTKDPEGLLKQADTIAERTQFALAGLARGVSVLDPDRTLVQEVVDALKEEFDPVHGGFGSTRRRFRGPKFPTPPYLGLLHQEAKRAKSEELDRMLALTLDRMARGGIYDHLGGGFHRYSTERTWTVPHFEKMLYDNAQLTELYAREFQRTRNPAYARVVRETLAFVFRELTSPEGAFWSALDADSEGEEGRFYVWTPTDLKEALKGKKDTDLFRRVHGAADSPNFEEKYHIFTLPKPLAEAAREEKLGEADLEGRLAPLRKDLFQIRAKRPRPFLDTKVLTAWNGQMIAGCAVAGACLGEPEYTKSAVRAAEFVLTRLRTKEGRLLRSFAARPGTTPEARLNGYLDDYAYLTHGLLCLHDATGEKRWLDEARRLTELTLTHFGEAKVGGYYYTSNDHEKLFARSKDQYDGAQPSGNSVAARNLVRLWQKTGDERWRAEAEKCFRAFTAALKANPTGMTALAEALSLYLDAQPGAKKPLNKP